MSAWTFERLIEADKDTLEEVLRAGTAPDPEVLAGMEYRGYNRDLPGRLAARKFCKRFEAGEEGVLGHNVLVRQDRRGHEGDWELRMRRGRARGLGHFRVGQVADASPPRLRRPYPDLGYLHYGVRRNSGLNVVLRVIRDVVALPEPGNHDLVLGKAFLQLGPGWPIMFATYFVLGHPRPVPDDG